MGVKRPLDWESQTTELRPQERLVKLRPDWHVRRGRDGEHKVFLCEDKRGEHLICTQKLTLLAKHINQLVGDDRAERISATSLYNVLTNDGGGLNGAYSKHRWRVRAYPLDHRAIDAFESSRQSFQKATVLGSKLSLQTRLCA